jgi:hypothetical protein
MERRANDDPDRFVTLPAVLFVGGRGELSDVTL